MCECTNVSHVSPVYELLSTDVPTCACIRTKVQVCLCANVRECVCGTIVQVPWRMSVLMCYYLCECIEICANVPACVFQCAVSVYTYVPVCMCQLVCTSVCANVLCAQSSHCSYVTWSVGQFDTLFSDHTAPFRHTRPHPTTPPSPSPIPPLPISSSVFFRVAHYFLRTFYTSFPAN